MTQISGESAAFPAQTFHSSWYTVAKLGAWYLLAETLVGVALGLAMGVVAAFDPGSTWSVSPQPGLIGFPLGLFFVLTKRRLGAYITYGVVAAFGVISTGRYLLNPDRGPNLAQVGLSLVLFLAIVAAIMVGMRSLAGTQVGAGAAVPSVSTGAPEPFEEPLGVRAQLPLLLAMGGALLSETLASGLSVWRLATEDARGSLFFPLAITLGWLLYIPVAAGVVVGVWVVASRDPARRGSRTLAFAAIGFGSLFVLTGVAAFLQRN